MHKLNIISYADKRYSMFALPYTFFALSTNNHATVEIFFEELDEFLAENISGIGVLRSLFGERFSFMQSINSKVNIIPNTIRFIEKPSFKSQYIYIGDIDLLILDDVMQTHLALMNEYDIPFSNILRESSLSTPYPRLSGLHFCKYDDYYPIPDISDLDLTKVNDEYVLYEIMSRKNISISPDFQLRPECGIHMSLNRDPLGRVSSINNSKFSTEKSLNWSGSKYYNAYNNITKTNEYASIFQFFDFEFKLLSLTLEATINKKLAPKLHRIACSYMADRRVFSNVDTSQKELLDIRDHHIKSGDLHSAMDLSSKLVTIWPESKELWFKYIWNAKAIGDKARVELGISHLTELDHEEFYTNAI
ncbi:MULTISPECIES: hypothetical protein [Aeromonas]|uniref:hypothetical protein n=1 Tax=Aeromonas TaxID=642 RepID=UPI0005A6F2B0|nr:MULTISPECIES: hypothetical protein [Aeromonas]